MEQPGRATAAERWRVDEVAGTDRALLAALAAITRDAFVVGDLYPGLPAADGASDTAESLIADISAGIRLWLAKAGDGTIVGCVRAIPRSGSIWQIRRLAVVPGLQGRGVARRLVTALESAARAEGVTKVVVWALVERGIPPLYSHFGYRTTGHFASPDKPLSEAIMEVRLGAPRAALRYPWGTEPWLAGDGAIVSWFSFSAGTAAVLGSLRSDARAVVRAHAEQARERVGPVTFIGGDGWLDGGARAPDVLCEQLSPQADSASGPVLTFARACDQVKEFTIPRQREPRLLALWRVPWQRSQDADTPGQ
jgi:predicted N-acetyltransferase YhbS